MTSDMAKAKSLFLRAIEDLRPDQWPAFLDVECADDAAMRRQVERLLKAHGKLGTYRALDEATLAPTIDIGPDNEKAGTVIGHYKLVHEIGQGGMGVVYMAAQSQPIKRNVALKIIKPGMDTREVVSRFDAERQALALMDHPNIAHVHDGGSTDSGRPYFVMELVEGLPITDFCDECRYTTPQRLEVFVKVCQAVQHAHQKGIIHRDVKPSNILVTTADNDIAVPKVIDFGIAKAIHQPLTEQSLHTKSTHIVGTPMYMSPEQAQLGGQDVDTRTDVYSLGIVLYQLLTGTTPFDKERLDRSGLDEVRRIIREEEPPRPSTRLSTVDTALETIAEKHGCDPQALTRELGGELDWIVMKCLEKDRTRRYESASELAKDIQRHLDDEPVEACPPSTLYRLQKFARRNKVVLGTGLAVSTALVIGMVVSLWQASVAQQARRLADGQRERAEANFQLAMQAMDELYLQAIGERRLLREEGDELSGSGQPTYQPVTFSQTEKEFLQRGLDFYAQFAQQNQENPQALFETGKAFYRVAMFQIAMEENDEAGEAFGEAISRLERLTQHHPTESKYFLELGKAYFGQARWSRWWPSASDTFTEAKEAFDRAIELQPKNPEALRYRGNIHKLLTGSRAALADYQMAIQLEPENADLHWRLAVLLKWGQEANLRDYDAALRHAKQAVKLEPQNWNYCQLLAQIHSGFADKASAIAVWEQWIPLSDSPHKAAEAQSIISQLAEKHQETIQHVDRYMETLGAQEPDATAAWLYLRRGKANASLGKAAEAIADLKKAQELDVITQGPFYLRVAEAFRQLGADDLALAACDKAEKVQPGNSELYYVRGVLYLHAGRYQESLADFTRGIELAPRKAIQYKYRGAVHFMLRRYEEALADLQKALELNPNDPSCVYWVNPALVARCPDKAFREGVFKLADRAIEITDDLPYAYGARGVLHAGSGRTAAALDDLAKSIELDPQHFFWYEWQYWFALIQLSEGNLDAYRKACAEILNLVRESKDNEVLYATAWTCSLGPDAVKDFSPVIHLANKAVDSEPKSIAFLNALGAVLHRAGRSEEAIKRLIEANDLIKDGQRWAVEFRASIGYFLAMANHQLGQDVEAAQWLNKANEQAEKAIANETAAYNWWHGRIALQTLRREAEALLKQAENNDKEPTGKPEETRSKETSN